MSSDQDVISFEALAASQRWSIYWGFLWRQLVLTVAGIIASVIFNLMSGFLIVGVGEALGRDSSTLQSVHRIVSSFVGVGIALFLYFEVVRWMFRSRISQLHIRLVRNRGRDAT